MTRISWDQYGLNIAYAAASRSEDQHHRVGAALFRADHSVASIGYNGAPPGVDIDWSDRDNRRSYVIHAEANALRYVHAGEVETMVSTMMPCGNCVLLASAYGVKRIVYFEELDPAVYDVEDIRALARTAGIEITKESE